MSLFDRSNKDGQLSREQRDLLAQLSINYAAAVSAYNDIDERITIAARDYAERPSEAWWNAAAGEEAFALIERRSKAIVDLARARKMFEDTYRDIFNATPGIA